MHQFRPRVVQHNVFDRKRKKTRKRRGNCITYQTVSTPNVDAIAQKLEAIWKPLKTGALPDRERAVLEWVNKISGVVKVG